AVILAGAAAPIGVLPALKPAEARHAGEQRVQGAGADFITVAAKFRENPLAVNRLLARVVQDVNLPESEQDFAVQRLQVHAEAVLRKTMSLHVIVHPWHMSRIRRTNFWVCRF